MEILREFFTAGSVPVLVSFSCPSTMVACSPAIKGWLFSTQSTFGLTLLNNSKKKNYSGPGIYLNVTFTFVGCFTNVEFNVNTLPGRDDLIILGLHWIKHWTGGPLITGKCVGQYDANTFKFFTNLIISTINVISCTWAYQVWYQDSVHQFQNWFGLA